jgi:hypothetical protein
MNTCICAFGKFILSTPNLRSENSDREREKDERSTARAVPKRSSNTDPTGP